MPLSIELRTLSSLFSFDVRNEGGVACLYARLDEDDFEAAAFAVAYGIAHRRIGHNDRLFQAWLAAAQAEADEADPSKRDVELLIAGLLQNVGVPESPVTPAHLHGLVAEELWLEVISQHDLGLGIPIRVEGHDWSVTDPGGMVSPSTPCLTNTIASDCGSPSTTALQGIKSKPRLTARAGNSSRGPLVT